MNNANQAPSPLADLIARFWGNRIKVTAAFVAIMAGTAGFTAISEPTYRSMAKLNVRVGRNSAGLDPTVTTGQFVAVADPREAEINAVADLVASRGVLEAVIAEVGENRIRGKKDGELGTLSSTFAFLDPVNLNPFRVYSTQDDAVKKLSKKLKIGTTRNSSVVDISCDATSPELAKDILTSLIAHVRVQHNKVNQTVGSHEFFADELKAAKEELTSLENRREQLKNRIEVSDLQVQREKILTRIRFLEDAIDDTKANLASIETDVRVRTQMLDSMPTSIVTEETSGEVNSIQDNMRQEVFRLETREKELLAKFTEESIYVRQIREQIAEAKKVMDSEDVRNKVTRGVFKPNEEMQIALNNAKAQRDALQAKLAPLEEQLSAEKARLQVINENEKEFVSLDREIRLAENQFLEFHKAYQQTVVDQGLEAQRITNINELQTPTMSHTPSSPQPLVNMAFGLGLSILSALGLVTVSGTRTDASGNYPPGPYQPAPPSVHPDAAPAARPETVAPDAVEPLDDLVSTQPSRRPLPR